MNAKSCSGRLDDVSHSGKPSPRALPFADTAQGNTRFLPYQLLVLSVASLAGRMLANPYKAAPIHCQIDILSPYKKLLIHLRKRCSFLVSQKNTKVFLSLNRRFKKLSLPCMDALCSEPTMLSPQAIFRECISRGNYQLISKSSPERVTLKWQFWDSAATDSTGSSNTIALLNSLLRSGSYR